MNAFHFGKRAAALALALASLSFFGVSCETLDSFDDEMNKSDNPKENATYVLSVHEIVKYPRAQDLEMNIPTFSGGQICVNANPFLHSRNISKVDLVEEKDKPGFYDLDLSLDRRGRLLWAGLSVNFRSTQLAFVIDGVYYRSFSPEILDNDEDSVVRIKGPFDNATAQGIKRMAEKNYKTFSEKDKNKK